LSWVSFKRVRSARGIATILAALILLLYFVRPAADGLRTRIAGAIGSALGRHVEISSVSVRFLPQPGFDLENFVVYDDPAFGGEPVVRAQEVTAALRFTSLLRGRLEISRLSLNEPSLNLVRSLEGRWNFSGLVERAAKVPVAPTSKTNREPRPGFPYIEASNGRINFKLGQEKKAFALTDADFSLWQDSENAWSMRLKAQPTRTNSNLTDTGTLRVEGSWQRSSTIAETPLDFRLQWENAQLGQFTRMATGADRGWRGALLLSAALSGTPGKLKVSSDLSIQDFRRFDILSGDALRLSAQCTANYDAMAQVVMDLACNAPVGSGAVALAGSIRGFGAASSYDLSLSANDVPMPSLVSLLERMKKDIPDDLVSAGKLNAQVSTHAGGSPNDPIWQGSGTIQGMRLVSPTNTADLVLDRIPFTINRDQRKIDVGPLRVPLGASSPVNLHGWVTPVAYSLQMQGDTRIKNLLQAARIGGLSYARPNADGAAKVAIQVSGNWSGFGRPDITGHVRLTNVEAQISGVNSPLEIASATVLLQPAEASAQDVTASLGQTTWRGSLSVPRHCERLSACLIQFEFQTKELDGDQLAVLFIPGSRKPWYRFLSSPEAGNSFLANLNASGILRTGRLTIHQVSATQVSSKVEWKNRRLELTDLQGTLLGGNHTGDWSADFSAGTPRYSGHGAVRHASLRQLAQLMHDDWVIGTASASYEINASGANATDFLTSIHGALSVEARESTLPHVILSANAGPVFAKLFTGKIALRNGRLDIQEGKLETDSGIYQVSGSALKGQGLNLRLLKDDIHGFAITGPLATPHIVAVGTPETRAELKQ
jgi:uncharacterized protein involved in outer membrane biogenesis